MLKSTITKTTLLFTLITVVLFSCGNNKEFSTVTEQKEKEDYLLTQFFEENNIDAQKTESGLYYVLESGTGDPITSSVRINYKGWIFKGNIFDEGDLTITTDGRGGIVAVKGVIEVYPENYADSTLVGFPLRPGDQNTVIDSWAEVTTLFQKSDDRLIVYSPSRLAYGVAGTTGIPSNAILVFDMQSIPE